MTSRISYAAVATMFLAVVQGCSHTMAEVPLADGNVLVIEGYGTKSSVQLTCLSEDAIQQLIGTQIPDGIEAQSCFQVAVASSNSSDISKAISSFVAADAEFGKMIQGTKASSPTTLSVLAGPDARTATGIVERIARGITLNAALDPKDGEFERKVKGTRRILADPSEAIPLLKAALDGFKSGRVQQRLRTAIQILATP